MANLSATAARGKRDFLASRSILIVGLGALGCPAADGLFGAGVGRMILVDHDRVDLSNLARQILFDDGDIGRSKVETAREALQKRHPNSETRIDTMIDRLDATNATEFFEQVDIVVDATDHPPTKALINAVGHNTDTPTVYGGAVRLSGQVFLSSKDQTSETPCLACVYPELEPGNTTAESRGCAAEGILAPVAGVIGYLQAAVTVSALAKDGLFSAGELVAYDASRPREDAWKTWCFNSRPECTVCGPVDHGEYLECLS